MHSPTPPPLKHNTPGGPDERLDRVIRAGPISKVLVDIPRSFAFESNSGMTELLLLENVPSRDSEAPPEPLQEFPVRVSMDGAANGAPCPPRPCSTLPRRPPTSDSSRALEQGSFQLFLYISENA